MFNHSWCEGCAYNTNKYAQGCEAFTEMPFLCENHTNKDRKHEIESVIKLYGKTKISYNAFSGGCGKYCQET